MKIVFTVDSLNAGGAERVISTLANQFSNFGDQIFIILVSYNKNTSFYKLNNSIQTISLVEKYNKKVNPFKRIFLLKKIIKKIKPDLVISFLSHIIIYTWLSLIGTKIPFFVSERNDPNQYKWLFKVLLKRAFRKADGCVFQTKKAMEWYGKGIFQKSSIIYNPVFLTCEKKKEQKRRNEIVTVGRLTEQKNYFFLLDVFKNFSLNYHNFDLKIYVFITLK